MIDIALLAFAQLLFGWLIADLLGGIVHWLEDRMLSARTPLIGHVIAANRLHHAEPMAFTAKGLVERNLATWLVACSVSVLWVLLFGPSLVWVAASVGGAVSSVAHFLAHVRSGNRVVRTLQDIGLLQSAGHHAGHHRPGAARRYCVLTSLLNPILDNLGFWSALERIGSQCGIRPVEDMA